MPDFAFFDGGGAWSALIWAEYCISVGRISFIFSVSCEVRRSSRATSTCSTRASAATSAAAGPPLSPPPPLPPPSASCLCSAATCCLYACIDGFTSRILAESCVVRRSSRATSVSTTRSCVRLRSCIARYSSWLTA
jgi:hypothetical protein